MHYPYSSNSASNADKVQRNPSIIKYYGKIAKL